MKKAALIILDGWGIGDGSAIDATAQAHTPFYDKLLNKHLSSNLKTHGQHVGLPKGQMGNSEVGHLNIGAGRIILQELAKIDQSIENRTFFENPTLVKAIERSIQKNTTLHLMGLTSDGGVHSHINHLFALLDVCKQKRHKNVKIHAFLDGRDTDPKSGINHIERLENHLDTASQQLATVIGRYYAMDRDKRWERTQKAYDLLVCGKGEGVSDFKSSIQKAYQNNITDEFMHGLVAADFAGIKEEDTVIFFNFRTDRPRQITECLTQNPQGEMRPLTLDFLSFTNYNQAFKNIEVVFKKTAPKNTLGEVLSKHQKTQVRAAETEKYPHVTFFFSGTREAEFDLETRILAPSPKVATYDLQPEMSAELLTNKTMEHLNTHQPDFLCLNYANPDMVGHTGVYDAIIKAVETVDQQLERLVNTLKDLEYEILIIADHGNAEKTKNSDGTPHTAHTTNLVNCIYVGDQFQTLKDGVLADIAPSILKIMGVDQPKEMTGTDLFS